MKKTTIAAALCLLAVASAHAADNFGADRHVARGLECQTCHGSDLKNLEYPTIETCTQCHNTKGLSQKTADVKPHNPHLSPHYQDQLDCTNCHLQHAETENYCNQCHQFDFKVP